MQKDCELLIPQLICVSRTNFSYYIILSLSLQIYYTYDILFLFYVNVLLWSDVIVLAGLP